MLALRRVSARCRNQGGSLWTARTCCVKSDLRGVSEKCNTESAGNLGTPFDRLIYSTKFCSSRFSFVRSYARVYNFVSEEGEKSNGEEDDNLEDGFSELENENNDDEGGSNPGITVEDDASNEVIHDLETISQGGDVEEKISESKWNNLEMIKAIRANPASSLSTNLDKWVKEGNEVTQAEFSLAMLNLRRRKNFSWALQMSEWMVSRKHLELTDKFYASHVDLIAKVRGISKAEEYVQHIPDSMRSELVYRSLLANCVFARDKKKSEEIFCRMKELNFPISSFACNQMLLLYKRTDKKKIADILVLMENENIMPSIHTYQVLVSIKEEINDIKGMEKIVETLKAEGREPNTEIQSSLARCYAAAGLKDKANEILKEIEGSDITKNRWACRMVLPIYATLGRDEDVDRIWKLCESYPFIEECLAGIEAWGLLKKVEKAEAAFEKLLAKVKRPPSKHFNALLKVYVDNKMLTKGKDLVRQMDKAGCQIGPLTWDGLVRLYIGAGEVEKALSILEKAVKRKQGKPLICSFNVIMETCALRGDVHNAEKIFLIMKQMGYMPRARQYQTLIRAYKKANAPAYGFVDRMKADNVHVDDGFAHHLAQIDAFKTSALSELLD